MSGSQGMHVLLTADTVGGVWTYAREMVTGLSARGVRVTLVSFGEIPTADQTAWMDGLEGFDYRPTAFRLEWMQDCEEDLRASSEFLAAIVDEVKPDLLHINQFYYGNLETEAPRLVVAHSDVVSWWNSVHKKDPDQSKWVDWYRTMVSRGLAGAHAVVAPSNWMLQTVRSNFVEPRFSSVIYNGRNPGLFNPHISKMRQAASVGRIWDFGKNASLLTKIDSPFPIHLAGSEQGPEEHTTTLHAGENHRVYFKGVLNEQQLQQLYARSAVYIATSRYEPFGLAPLEAALSRCALVMSDIPTFRELWGDGALYFRENDPASLESALEKLHEDAELCATYGKLAYDRALQRFTASRMLDDYLHLYQALTRKGALAA